MPKQTAAAARARPRADLNLDRWIQSPEWPGARFVAPRPERALCHCRRRHRRCRRRYRRRLRHLRWRRRDILLRSSVCSRASLAGGSVSRVRTWYAPFDFCRNGVLSARAVCGGTAVAYCLRKSARCDRLLCASVRLGQALLRVCRTQDSSLPVSTSSWWLGRRVVAATTQVRLLVWTISWGRRFVPACCGWVAGVPCDLAVFRGSARLVAEMAARDLCAFGLRAASC